MPLRDFRSVSTRSDYLLVLLLGLFDNNEIMFIIRIYSEDAYTGTHTPRSTNLLEVAKRRGPLTTNVHAQLINVWWIFFPKKNKKKQSACYLQLDPETKEHGSSILLWTMQRDLQNLLGGHTRCGLIGSFLSNEIPLLLLLLQTDLCLLNSLLSPWA